MALKKVYQAHIWYVLSSTGESNENVDETESVDSIMQKKGQNQKIRNYNYALVVQGTVNSESFRYF